jgi:hypothetical protein
MIAVIVEEAAEVMESHIVVSLTHHCEHLILIGMCCYCIYLYVDILNFLTSFKYIICHLFALI